MGECTLTPQPRTSTGRLQVVGVGDIHVPVSREILFFAQTLFLWPSLLIESAMHRGALKVANKKLDCFVFVTLTMLKQTQRKQCDVLMFLSALPF